MDKLIDLLFKTLENKGHTIEIIISEEGSFVPIVESEIYNKDYLIELIKSYLRANLEWYEHENIL